MSSTATNQNLRTSFGTLSFEESTEEETVNDGADRRTKVLRLKEGADYPIQITGTGRGTMNYSIGLIDRSGEYTDFRRFEGIPITNTTVIVAKPLTEVFGKPRRTKPLAATPAEGLQHPKATRPMPGDIRMMKSNIVVVGPLQDTPRETSASPSAIARKRSVMPKMKGEK